MTATHYQNFRVKAFSGDIEEEVVLEREGYELTCFASNHPAYVEEGQSCLAVLTFLVLDDFDLTPLGSDEKQSLERIGEGFAYKIVGTLSEGRLISCGFEFSDETFETDFAYLNGQTVAISVDRINVEFLKARQ